MTYLLRGSCLCGTVTYEIASRFLYAGYCHCSQCRKTSGSAFAAVGGVNPSSFVVTHGQDMLRAFAKGPNSTLRFCGACGSGLFVEKNGGRTIHLRLGTLDSECQPPLQAHIYVGSKASWFELPNDGLPRYEEEPPEVAYRDDSGKARDDSTDLAASV